MGWRDVAKLVDTGQGFRKATFLIGPSPLHRRSWTVPLPALVGAVPVLLADLHGEVRSDVACLAA